MIRRGFWLTVGAAAGIYGYRRASAVGRRLSASLKPGASLKPRTSLTPKAAAGLAAETVRFTRDVREGMELYRLTHSAPAGSTLMTDHDHDEQPEEGR